MMSILAGDGRDFDFLERISLHRAQLIEPNQLEQREKCHHDFQPRYYLPEQFGEEKPGTVAHPFKNHIDLVRHAETFGENLPEILASLDPFDDFLESVNELKNSNFVQRQRHVGDRTVAADFAGEDSFLFKCSCVQRRRRFLKFFILDQLANQIPARVVLFGIFFWWLLVERKKAAALEIN